MEIAEVEEMVDYILSLDETNQNTEKTIALEGSITFDKHLQDAEAGKYILMASYLDQGHPDLEESALSAVEQIVFQAPKIEMEDAVDLDNRTRHLGKSGKNVSWFHKRWKTSKTPLSQF